MPMTEIPNCPTGMRCQCYSDGSNCVCGLSELFLRAVSNTDNGLALSEAQREWCLNEIGRVEGYVRDEWTGVNDGLLANGVLNAWRDYCRDKGNY